MAQFQINYLAVGVAALVPFFIGALWYSPLLFGNFWLKAHGYSKEQAQKTAGRAYVVSLFCYVVLAYVLAVVVSWAGASTALQGVFLGFLVWVGFLATVGLTANVYSERPLSTYLLDAGYQLLYSVVMGAVLAVWR